MYNLFFLIKDENIRNIAHLCLIPLFVIIGILFSNKLSNKQTDEKVVKIFRKDIFVLDIILLFVLLLSAAFRFYGLDWGLPRPYHPDEFEEAAYLLDMINKKTIISNYYQQPPLILYFSWIVEIFLKWLELFSDNSLVRCVFAGRIVNAVAGIFSVFLVYKIGKRLSSRFVGVIAASLLAVSPLHVTNSRYMKQDVLLVSFVIACLLAVLKNIDTKKYRYLYMAGIFAGLAAASKYSGAACMGMIFVTAFLQEEKLSIIPDWKTLFHSVASFLLMILTFLLTVPFVLFNKEHFSDLINGIKFESLHAKMGHHGYSVDAWSQLWMFHFSRSLITGMGLFSIILALVAVGIYLKKLESKYLLLVLGALFFYVPAELANSKPPPQPDRYVLPCVPFLALLSAEALKYTTHYLSRKKVYFLIFLLLIFPFANTFLLATELTYDTRSQMSDWLYDNLPENSKIITLGAASYLPKIPQKFKKISGRKVISRDKTNIINDLKNSGSDYIISTTFSTERFRVQNVDKKNVKALRVRAAMQEIKENFQLVKKMEPKWGTYGFHNPIITIYSLK